jgi:hypothetical protein
MKAAATAGLLLLFSGCGLYGPPAQPCPNEPGLSVCELVGEASAHNNTEVTVRGKYQSNPEYSVMFGDECHATMNAHYAGDYKESPGVRRSFAHLLGRNNFAVVEVLVRGTFHAAGSQECFGQGCSRYDLLIHEVRCVRAPPIPSPGKQ